MNNLRSALLFLMTLVVAASCSMPETKIYSVTTPPAGRFPGQHPEASVVVLLDCPRYLAQPYIAYRTSPYQLQISRYSKWEAPPEEIVRDAFREAFATSGLFREVKVSSAVPEGFHSLRVTLKRFERSDEENRSWGDLLLDVALFSPEGKEVYRRTIVKKTGLADRSFLSLAQGLSSALEEALGEVRGDLAGIMKSE